MAISNEEVSVWEFGDCGDPFQGDPWDIVSIERPDNFFLGIDHDNIVTIAVADDGIAVGEPVDTVGFEACFEFPDDNSLGVVFTDAGICFMGDEIMSIWGFAHHSCVAVRVWIIYGQGDIAKDVTLIVDFDDAAWTAFSYHGETVGQSLEGMDFHFFSFVAIFESGVIGPDGMTLRCHLQEIGPACLKQDISIGKDLKVMNILNGVFP